MGGPAVTSDPLRITRRTAAALWAAFLGIALAAIIALIPLPYAVLRPGPATNTLGKGSDGKPLVTVVGAPTYPTTGALDFTTVSVSGGPGRRVNAWDLLGAYLSSSAEIYREDQLFAPGTTSEQVKERNAAEMTSSQEEATAVALRSIGKTVTTRYAIASVAEGTPAAAVLKPDDIVLAVDGTTIASLADIQRLVRAHTSGQEVRLTIRRAGKDQDVSARTTTVEGVTALGVRMQPVYDYPFEVTIDAGDVGGPSAGTMFALAVRDILTPGAMTGGKKIAGTGTIDDAGEVGPIGGIRQKIVGAKEAGATYFLAPADNCRDLAGEQIEGITVVRIATFDDAVHAVDEIAAGGSDLPRCG